MNKLQQFQKVQFSKYCSEHSDRIVEMMNQSKLYIWAPTGSGKTYMVNQIAELYEQYNVYLYEPTNSIVTQQLSKSYKSRRLHIKNWDAIPEYGYLGKDDLIFIDEAHFITDIATYRPSTYKRLIELLHSSAHVCLLSGTPYQETHLATNTVFIKLEQRIQQQTINVNPINLNNHDILTYVKSYINERLFILCKDATSLDIIQRIAEQSGKTCCTCRSYEKQLYNYTNNVKSNLSLRKQYGDEYDIVAETSDAEAKRITKLIEYRDDVITREFTDTNGRPFDIIACTCYCEAGIDISWYDGRRVIVDGVYFGARDVVQFAARFRSVSCINVDFVDYHTKSLTLLQHREYTINRIVDIQYVREWERSFEDKLEEVVTYGARVGDVIDDSTTYQQRIDTLEKQYGKLKVGRSTNSKHTKQSEHSYVLTKDSIFGTTGATFTKSEIIKLNKGYMIKVNQMNNNFSLWCSKVGFARVKKKQVQL